MPKLPLKFSPLKLLKSLAKEQRPRFEQLMDEAPRTPEYYSKEAVDRLLSRTKTDRIATVDRRFPFVKLAAPDFTDELYNDPDDLQRIQYLMSSIKDKGLKTPPMLDVGPVDGVLDLRPQVFGHDGRHRMLALSKLGMDERPIAINRAANTKMEYLDDLVKKYGSILDEEGYESHNRARIKPFREGGMTSPLRQYGQYAEGGKTRGPEIGPQDNPIKASDWMNERIMDTPLGYASDWLYHKLGLTLGELALDPIDQFINRPMAGIRQSLVQGSVKPFVDALDDVGESAAEYALMNVAGEVAIVAAKRGAKAVVRQGKKAVNATVAGAKRLGRMIQDHVIEHPESVTP